jgi:hypothetical protein
MNKVETTGSHVATIVSVVTNVALTGKNTDAAGAKSSGSGKTSTRKRSGASAAGGVQRTFDRD